MPRAKKNIPVQEVLEVTLEEVAAAPSQPAENLEPSSLPVEKPLEIKEDVVKVKKERAPRKPKEMSNNISSTQSIGKEPSLVAKVAQVAPIETPKLPMKAKKEPSELDIKKKLLKDREMILKEKQLALKELELEKKRLRLEAVQSAPKVAKVTKVVKEEPEEDSDDEKIHNLKAADKETPKAAPIAPKIVTSKPQMTPRLTPQQILAMGGF